MGWASGLKGNREAGRGDRSIETARAARSVPPRGEPRAVGKISAALVELIEPYREHELSLGDYQTLITVGVVAWNLSLLPEDERKQQLYKSLREEGISDPAGMDVMIHELVKRKTELFPLDSRMILHYQATATPDGFHVEAAGVGYEPAHSR